VELVATLMGQVEHQEAILYFQVLHLLVAQAAEVVVVVAQPFYKVVQAVAVRLVLQQVLLLVD
jgi:hypothetical protein